MRVLVVVALPDAQELVPVELPEGARLADALVAARVAERHPGLALDRVGVWGRVRPADAALRDGDRVEVYRPIRADAKALRRQRAGVRSSTRSRSGP
jgi:putative ubiquitin-RnfH superfamily antitoxin RatB of RatAB toxin-antitoxin module